MYIRILHIISPVKIKEILEEKKTGLKEAF